MPDQAEAHTCKFEIVEEPLDAALGRRCNRIGHLLRQRLRDTHHAFHELAVRLEPGKQRQRAIPIQQVVIDPPIHTPEHVLKHRAMFIHHSKRDTHHSGERFVHVSIRIPGERECQRRCHAGVALHDIRIVPYRQFVIRLGFGGAQRRDRPRLQHMQLLPVERPFDILRRSEMLRRAPRHCSHFAALDFAQHSSIANDLGVERFTACAHPIAVAVRFTTDQLVRQPKDRTHHDNVAITRNRVSRKGHASRARFNHHLNNHCRRLRCAR